MHLEQFLQSVDPAVLPLGIITLEDILEGSHSLSDSQSSTDHRLTFTLVLPNSRTHWRGDLRRV